MAMQLLELALVCTGGKEVLSKSVVKLEVMPDRPGFSSENGQGREDGVKLMNYSAA